MIYPSKFGLSLGALSAMLYLASIQTQSGLLFLVLGIVGGCYLVNGALAARAASGLVLSPPASMKGMEGQPVKGTWEIGNSSRRQIGFAQVIGAWGDLFRVGALVPGAVLHATPELVFPRRGVYSFSSLQVVSSYPFGLVRCRRRLPVTGEIVVYPAVYNCPPPAAAGFEPMVGGRYTGRNKSSSGENFHGVRPARPTDPVKLIHWPLSSKGMGLMVKEFDEELSGRVAIILGLVDGAAGRDPATVDAAARAAGSLLLAALDAGHQAEFAMPGMEQPLSVPPFADGEVVLDALARLVPETAPAVDSRGLAELLRHLPRKAALCVVMTDADSDVMSGLRTEVRAFRRTVAVYIPEASGGDGDGEPMLTVKRYGARQLSNDSRS